MEMMDRHPGLQRIENLSPVAWAERRQLILRPSSWGAALELRLLALGLAHDIVVLTGGSSAIAGARIFPCTAHTATRHMAGGHFEVQSLNDIAHRYHDCDPRPYFIIFNGRDHYDSTTPC